MSPPVNLNPNRHSAPLPTTNTASAISGPAGGVTSAISGGPAGRATSAVGRPISLTLPPSSRGSAPASGVESMAEGLEKTTRAQVDVARRGFWRKCLGVGAGIAGVAILSVATAGFGTLGLVGLGLLGALVAKGSLDATLSLMNWRNLKADHLGQPPPFAFLTRLPEAVRQDATAAGLVGLGMSEKSATRVSGALDLALGLSATVLLGYQFGGLLGSGLALVPVGLEQGLSLCLDRVEARRQRHVEAAHSLMTEVAAQTQQALDDLEDLQDRLRLPIPLEPEAVTDSIDALHPRADKIRQEALELTTALREQLQDRVANKARAGTAGIGALVLDSVSEGGANLSQTLSGVPYQLISLSAMTLRTGLEYARTVRSEKRDNEKLQTFLELHGDLQQELGELRKTLQAQLDSLELLSLEARSDRDGGGSGAGSGAGEGAGDYPGVDAQSGGLRASGLIYG